MKLKREKFYTKFDIIYSDGRSFIQTITDYKMFYNQLISLSR
jgi:hypothetical protein